MNLLKIFFQRIKRFFKKSKITSREEEHWVDHIFDTTFPGHKAGPGGWCNVHGFAEHAGDKLIYWIGFDNRSFGFRVQDELVKCKTYEMYKKYLAYGPKNWEVHNAIRDDPALYSYSGNNVNINFIFKWVDGEKSFNIAYSLDLFGEEK